MEPIQSSGIYQTIDTHEMPIRKLKLRSSPPLLRSISDEFDENDCSTKIEDQQNNSLNYHRPSRPILHSGYYRKKSHSLKLTRHDENDSCPKKAVRFADDFGLELSQMKMINTDELPFIPKEAFKHLQINHEYRSPLQERMKVITYMELKFENPMYTQGFNDRVSRQKVVLEQASEFHIH